MISSTPEVWKTCKSTAVFLLSQRRTFDLFVCLCYRVEWYEGVGETQWHLTDLMSCKSMFSLILSPPLSFYLLTPHVCVSLSRPLIFDALHSSRMRNCHIFYFCFSFYRFFNLFITFCVSLIWFNLISLGLVYSCTVSDLMFSWNRYPAEKNSINKSKMIWPICFDVFREALHTSQVKD